MAKYESRDRLEDVNSRRENATKMDLKYDGCGLVLSVYRNQWLDFVSTVWNYLAPQNAGNLLNGHPATGRGGPRGSGLG